MPPSIDIYALTKSRDQETLERFASKYVDRPASEDLGDEQLMIFPIGENGESGEVADWDWEPALNLDHVFQRGLDYPRRAFTIYLADSTNKCNSAHSLWPWNTSAGVA